MPKKVLLAPGPTPLHEQAALAMAAPIIHHRHPEFAALFREVRAGLSWLWQTREPVLVLASTGTGAMEAALVNTHSPGDEVVVVRAGKFGERWAEIAQAYGLRVHAVDVTWGHSVEPAAVARALDTAPRACSVLWQASESSTGVVHPTRDLAALCRERGKLSIVDGVTAIGCFDVPFDAWGLDAVVCGSQKALMLPPGLGFVAFSPRAWRACETATLPRFYLDLRRERDSQAKDQTAFTPAIGLIVGLKVVLEDLKNQGLQNVFGRHAKLARATRAAALALGLELYSPDAPSDGVTAIRAPSGVDGQAVVKRMRETYGIAIAGGQGEAKGKIFRFGHMGNIHASDLLAGLGALEMCLTDLGAAVPRGAGVRAAQEVLASI